MLRAAEGPKQPAPTGGVIALVVAAVLALGGAVLGGIVGMRYHRKVDQYGLDQGPLRHG